MNGKKAKVFRMMAYGLKRHQKENELNDPRHRAYDTVGDTQTIVCACSRHDYKRFKKRYKEWVRNGRKHKV